MPEQRRQRDRAAARAPPPPASSPVAFARSSPPPTAKAAALATVAAAASALPSRSLLQPPPSNGDPCSRLRRFLRPPNQLNTTQPPPQTHLRDLLSAAQKAASAGVGDWSLDPLSGASADAQRRLLLGPLGPEALMTTTTTTTPAAGGGGAQAEGQATTLDAASVLRLYSALGAASYGCAREVASALAPLSPQRRAALLPVVWRCLGSLTDEAAGQSLPCEAALLSAELARAAQAAALARREAVASRAQARAAQRLSEEKAREAAEAAEVACEQVYAPERQSLKSALAAAVARARAAEVRGAGLEAALEVARLAADEEAGLCWEAERRLRGLEGLSEAAAQARVRAEEDQGRLRWLRRYSG
jgi:hypothetical protein